MPEKSLLKLVGRSGEPHSMRVNEEVFITEELPKWPTAFSGAVDGKLITDDGQSIKQLIAILKFDCITGELLKVFIHVFKDGYVKVGVFASIYLDTIQHLHCDALPALDKGFYFEGLAPEICSTHLSFSAFEDAIVLRTECASSSRELPFMISGGVVLEKGIIPGSHVAVGNFLFAAWMVSAPPPPTVVFKHIDEAPFYASSTVGIATGKERLDYLSFGRIIIFETRYASGGDTKYAVAWGTSSESAAKFDDYHTGGDSQYELTDALISSPWFPAVEAPDIETGLQKLRNKLESIPSEVWLQLNEAVDVVMCQGLDSRNFNKALGEYFKHSPASQEYFKVTQW